MKEVAKIFAEYGLDFHNNRFWFGRSTEVEYTDGTEIRTNKKVHFNKVAAVYMRIWIGKLQFAIDTDKPHFAFKKRDRRNFLWVFGISGIPKTTQK